MSIFSSIAKAEHTFVGWAEKELAVLYVEAPKIETIVAAGLKYAGPALQIVATTEAGPVAGAEVGAVLADAQAGLIAASGLVYDFGATPTVGSVINSVATNLKPLLAASKISNPKNVAIVTSVVDNLDSLTTAINNQAAPKA